MQITIQVGLIFSIYFSMLIAMATGSTIPKAVPYVLVCMITAMTMVFFRKGVMQVFVMLFFAIIIQKILIYRTYVGGIFAAEIAVLFVIAMYFLNMSSLDRRLNTNKPLLVAGVFFLACSLSSTVAIMQGVDIKSELVSFQVYVLWSTIFLLYGSQIRRLKGYSQINIERIFSVLTLLVAGLHMFAVFTGTSIEFVRADGVTGKIDASRYFRYGGVFGNVNVQSAFLVGGMAYGMFLYVRKSSMADKLLGSSAFVFGLVSCLISGSRMALLASFLLLVMFIFYQRKRLKEISHFLVGVTISAMLLASTQLSRIMTMFNRSMERIESKGSGDQREMIWKCTTELIPSNPLGMGVGNDLYWSKLIPCLGGGIGNPHNLILGVGVNAGFIGLVLMSVLLFFLLKKQISILLSGKKHEYSSNIFFLFIIFFFGMSEAFIFDLNKLHLIYFFVIGIVLATPGLKKNGNRSIRRAENSAGSTRF